MQRQQGVNQSAFGMFQALPPASTIGNQQIGNGVVQVAGDTVLVIRVCDYPIANIVLDSVLAQPSPSDGTHGLILGVEANAFIALETQSILEEQSLTATTFKVFHFN
jgi:hypothetical protein